MKTKSLKGPRPATATPELGWLTREELAAAIPVSARTVDQWRLNGWIPFVKAKGIVRFDLDKVKEALLRQFEVKPKADHE
jgi:hypothetical protein